MKSADGLYRLVEFAAGRPDSRPDKATDWLRALTNEQLRIVQNWVEENGQEKRTEPADGAPAAPPVAESGGRRRAT